MFVNAVLLSIKDKEASENIMEIMLVFNHRRSQVLDLIA